MFSAIARLRPGITPAQASAEATARARAAEQRSTEDPSGTRKGPDPALAALAFFGSGGPAQITAVPVLDALTQEVRPALVALAVAGILLLVTAMGNVAGLQLARASSRIRELAIQSAIGAGARRIAGHLCLESLLLGTAGGAFGLLFTAAAHAALPSLLPADFPRLEDVSLDWIVLIFATALTLGSSVAVGLLPALHLRQLNLVEALMEGGSGSTSGKPGGIPRVRMAIIVTQIAIACVLLVAGSLLGRSFMAMSRADRGFDLENILTAPLSAPDFAFSPERRIQTLDILMERLRSLPGSPRIAFTTGLPLAASENVSGFRMPSPKPPVGTPVQVHAVRSVVTHDFFAVMGMRVGEGRAFDQRDTAISPKVVLVNRTFARQYLSDTPIGDRISNFAQGDAVEFEVIGILDDVRRRGLNEPPQPEIYSLNLQMTPRTFNPNFGSFVFRTSSDPHSLIDALKTIVHETDPSLTLRSILTMEDRLASSLARPRLYAVLSSAFAVSALIIASAGLFGVLSYTVTQRQRELAVRTALGARSGDIVRLVLREAVVLVGVGLTLGIAASLASVTYLSSLLYGVSPDDWINVAAVSLLTAGVALLACLIPALRAARVDPLLAMRS
jgi:putative ABC transport system permease protein